ncbi:MAG TPA: hypothetical protein VLJ88_19590 [Propionibacteriaceae bacterium]|nr:hypothetical protein [Propionibacteriaceae bacterium]
MRPLVRYLLAAILARGADAGAAIGLLLHCLALGDRIAQPVLTGSVLTAAIAAPHLVGPVLARRMDTARDSRRILALAMTSYGVSLAVGALLLGRAPLALVIILVALAGAGGPLITGGLSSHLVSVVGPGESARRRGEGWDAVSYGVSGSLGPALVALIAAGSSALLALLTLAGAALVAAVVTLALPPAAAGHEEVKPMRTRAVLALLVTRGPLRRVTYATMVTSLTLGGLGVITVQLSPRLGVAPAAGATLMAAFGVGNLVASLVVTARPLRGEPEMSTTGAVAVIGAGLAACALASEFPVALVGFFLVGAAQAPFVTATLAARAVYSPPGARAQIFVSVAALKVAAGSLGAPIIGALAFFDPRVLLVVGGALIGLTAAATVVDRRVDRRVEQRTDAEALVS